MRAATQPRIRFIPAFIVASAMLAGAVVALPWQDARAAETHTVQVTVPATGPTLFNPQTTQAAVGDTVRFVLVEGSSAVITSDSPTPLAFQPCSLMGQGSECLRTFTSASTITYSDKRPTGPSGSGTIVISAVASPSPTPSDSPTASPTGSPSATPSPTTSPTDSPSATPSPTGSPTGEPTASPSPTASATPTPGPTIHPRTLTFSLRGALIASGQLDSDDPGCYIGAPIDIQKKMKKKKKWKRVLRTFTDSGGRYQTEMPIRRGVYRAKSIRFSSPDGSQVCARVFSPKKRYRP